MVLMDGQPRGGTLGFADGAGHTDIVFAVEPAVHNKLPPWLIGDHFNEVGTLKDVTQRPNIDYKRYMEAQAKGEFMLVVARDSNKDVIGYVALFIQPHPHYAHILVASDDAHYLVPRFRGLRLGKAMIEYAYKEAAARGAKIFVGRVKAASNHGKIYEEMEFELQDLVYVKDLTNEKPVVD